MGELAERRNTLRAEQRDAPVNPMVAHIEASDRRLIEFRSDVQHIGTTGLYLVVARLGSSGGWRSRRVTIGDYTEVARGWVIDEAVVDSEVKTSRLFVTDEPQPRAVMCTPRVTKQPYYNEPPELPYAALHDSLPTLEQAVVPHGFAYDKGLTWLAAAAERLINPKEV